VEIDVVGEDEDKALEIQARNLPYSDTLFWSQSMLGKKPIDNSTGKRENTIGIHSLQERIERADTLIQSKAPSYIEFQAKQWVNNVSETTTAAPAPVAATSAPQKTDRNQNITAAYAQPPLPQTASLMTKKTTSAHDINNGRQNAIAIDAISALPLPPQAAASLIDAPAPPLPATTTPVTQNINNTMTTGQINYQDQQTFFHSTSTIQILCQF